MIAPLTIPGAPAQRLPLLAAILLAAAAGLCIGLDVPAVGVAAATGHRLRSRPNADSSPP